MGVFKSERRIWTEVTDLTPVAESVATHFRDKGYQVGYVETGAGAWDIDVTRSGVFRTVSGLRTSLKVRLEPAEGSVLARAGVGIVGQQVLPTVVTMLVFWPIIVTQVWGTIRAAKADDEALAVVEQALTRYAGAGGPAGAAAGTDQLANAPACTSCGARSPDARFCTQCGARVG